MKSRLRNLCVLLVVGAFAMSAVSAQAQVLLSNTSNTTGGDYGGTPDSSDHFTTGNAGMSVGEIIILWESLDSNPGPNRVGIFTEDGGFASTTQIGSWFTNPDNTTVGLMAYSGNAQLSPNTTYWVVIDIDDDSEVAYTFDDSFYSNPSTQGAVIEDNSAYGDWETASWSNDSANLQFEIHGDVPTVSIPIPTLGLTGMLLMIAVLLLLGAGVLRVRRA